MTLTDQTISERRMLDLGLMFPVFSGIQIDLNVVLRKMPDGTISHASMCDHNCTNEAGGYDCPAAFTVNKGVKPNFVDAEEIIEKVRVGRTGLMLARDQWMDNYFYDYCEQFKVPPATKFVMAGLIRSNLCEVNLFGGNPEMHKQILWIIARLKELGFRVNFTTTGRKLITDQNFVKEFAKNPPHLLALSADDFDPNHLEEVFQMPLPELAAEWGKVNKLHGQKQKFIEGVYTARTLQESGSPALVLFNMVLHSGNLRHFHGIMDTIQKYLPKAILNPYPAQDSFNRGEGNLFSAEDIGVLSELCDFFIEQTRQGNPNLTKRIQYWLVMRTVLDSTREHPTAASQLISGHHIWQCYRQDAIPGAGMYLQIGKGNPEFVQIDNFSAKPKLYAGCYWENRTVTSPEPVSTPEKIQKHLLSGMQKLASGSTSTCSGCSMPRLWFNMVTTELGLNPGLRERYLETRKQYVGF